MDLKSLSRKSNVWASSGTLSINLDFSMSEPHFLVSLHDLQCFVEKGTFSYYNVATLELKLLLLPCVLHVVGC